MEFNMAELYQPNVATSLILIHRILTRGIDVSTNNCRVFTQDGFPDTTIEGGYVDYVRSLMSLLHAHHLTEENQAFPYFKELIPDAPYDELFAEHQLIAAIISETNTAIDHCGIEMDKSAVLNDLTKTLVQLNELWQPHHRKEEKYFTIPILAKLIPPEEHTRLNRMYAQHNMEHSGPDYLIVPFMLFNLNDTDRALFAGEMPPELTEQLVPIVWKEKWEAMKPFLLE
jgi:hemerythrin-like domain-containing protein